MNPEELKNIWSQQTEPDAGVVRLTPELVWRLADESTRFERTIFWRDLREWLATAFVVGVFLFRAFFHGSVRWAVVAAAIIACLPMTYVALRRQKPSSPESSGSLADHLRNSIVSVQHQIRLLRSVLWWYLGPIALSMAIVIADALLRTNDPAGAGLYFSVKLSLYLLVTAVIFFAVWKLNQQTVRNKLEPRLQELEAALAELEASSTAA